MPAALAPHPFRPLTDAEYALLSRHLPSIEGRRGRPPQDRRRTLDAIFWIACSKGPWKDLPRCQSCHTGDAASHLTIVNAMAADPFVLAPAVAVAPAP